MSGGRYALLLQPVTVAVAAGAVVVPETTTAAAVAATTGRAFPIMKLFARTYVCKQSLAQTFGERKTDGQSYTQTQLSSLAD